MRLDIELIDGEEKREGQKDHGFVYIRDEIMAFHFQTGPAMPASLPASCTLPHHEIRLSEKLKDQKRALRLSPLKRLPAQHRYTTRKHRNLMPVARGLVLT